MLGRSFQNLASSSITDEVYWFCFRDSQVNEKKVRETSLLTGSTMIVSFLTEENLNGSHHGKQAGRQVSL